MLNKFSASINMPISTTNDISIIGLYSNNDGYILQLSENKNNAIGLFIKYFNGSFFSNYSYEQEHIFIGGYSSLQFNSILYMNNNHNYKIFLNAINIFIHAINGKQINNKPTKFDYII